MFHWINWDRVRLIILGVLTLLAFRRWATASRLRRGDQATLRLLKRGAISALAGGALSILALEILKSHSTHGWYFIPAMPGLFVAAVTVGVHRDDQLVWYVALFVNSIIYCLLIFACNTFFTRDQNSKRF